MRNLNRTCLISTIALMGALLCHTIASSQATQPTVRLTTDPPIDQLFPFAAEARSPQSPVAITLEAVNTAGQPLEAANIHLQLAAPAPTPWLSTDFPIVEGTPLLELEQLAPDGSLQLRQMLPIRGNYQLQVEVSPTRPNTFTAFQQTFTLPVRENSVKYRNLAILAVILLLVGLGGGLVIGGRQQLDSDEIAPQRVRLLLSGAMMVAIAALLLINLSALMSHSHSHHHSHSDHHSTSAQSRQLQVELSGDTAATVGELATFTVQVTDPVTKQPIAGASIQPQITALEDNWTLFTYQGQSNSEGKLNWQQQFFDGAPHQLTVNVLPPESDPSTQPLKVEQTIEVEGVEPPLLNRLFSLGYFTAIVIIGTLLGLWIRHPKSV